MWLVLRRCVWTTAHIRTVGLVPTSKSIYEAYSCSDIGVNRACDPASGGEALRPPPQPPSSFFSFLGRILPWPQSCQEGHDWYQSKNLHTQRAQGDEPGLCQKHAERMCTRRATSVVPKQLFLCERTSSRSRMAMCPGGDVTCFDAMRLAAGEMK